MAAVAGAVLALGACGNPIARLTTERAIGDAVSNQLAQPGLNMQISLGVTPAQLLQINRIEHGDRSFTPQVASALSRTSLRINVDPGQGESLQSKQFASDPNNRYEFAIQVGNAEPLQVRYVDGRLYARADLPTLISDFGGQPSTATKVQRELGEADLFVPGVAALGEGKWVSADLKALAPLVQRGASNTSNGNSAISQADARTLLNHIKSALTHNTTYSNVGNHGGRTEYQLKVRAHDFLQSLQSTLPNDLSSLAGRAPVPGASSIGSQVSKALDRALAETPKNETIAFQLWVKDNRAQEIDVDVNQFVRQFPFPVPLRFVFAPGTTVVAPSNATPLDFSKVSGLLGGLMGGAGGSSAILTPSG
jgi:hypothetical protein